MTPVVVIGIEPLAPEQFETVAGWLSSPEINQWLTSEWRNRTVDKVLMGVAVRNRKNRFYVARADGEACGVVALADIDAGDKTAMIWYVLGARALGGRGIATHAVRELVQIAFEELGLESVYAWIMEDNTPSRRVLEKAGFREAGRIRRATAHGGRQVDRVYFDMVRGEMRQARPAIGA